MKTKFNRPLGSFLGALSVAFSCLFAGSIQLTAQSENQNSPFLSDNLGLAVAETSVPRDNLLLVYLQSDFVEQPNAKHPNKAEEDWPSCTAVCNDVAFWWSNYLCFDPAPNTYCYCSISGDTLDNLTPCFAFKPSTTPPNLPARDYEKLSASPLGVFIAPYAGCAECKVSLGALNMIHTSNAVDVCYKNCGNTGQWSIRQIDKDNVMKGYYIRQAGDKGGYLYYDEENKLKFIDNPAKLSAENKKRLVWLVGGGTFDDEGKETGYRILSATNLLNGLVIDKKTGKLSVQQIFEKNTITKEGKEVPVFSTLPSCDSVWNLTDLKKKPIKKKKKGNTNSQ